MNSSANRGRNIAKTLITVAPVFSTVDTTELPNPPVVDVDATLNADSAELIVAAVPPPAIIPNPHFSMSLDSVNWDENNSVPAIAESGIAIESNKLSIKGI